VQGGADFAHQARRSGEGKVELQGNCQSGAFPDGLGRRGVATGYGVVDHHGGKLALAQQGQGSLASIGDDHFHFQLFSDEVGAIARSFDAGDK
jgi:hypothetical protein